VKFGEKVFAIDRPLNFTSSTKFLPQTICSRRVTVSIFLRLYCIKILWHENSRLRTWLFFMYLGSSVKLKCHVKYSLFASKKIIRNFIWTLIAFS